MADIIGLAQEFYDSAITDAGEVDSEAEAALKSARNTLRTAIANGTTTGVLTSASKNGVAYTQKPEIGPIERLRALSLAITGRASLTRPARVAYVRF